MDVCIIGGGALGKSLAALLMRKTHVMLYARTPFMLRRGFYLKEARSKQHVQPQIVTTLKSLRGKRIDLLIFATKVMDLRPAALEASGLEPRCIFLPQNGVFDFKWIKSLFKKAEICRGVTTMACQEFALDQVMIFYRGDMYMGEAGAPAVANVFEKNEINVNVYRDSAGCVWAKLIFSAVMNPLPVITQQGYRVLKNDKEIWQLVQQAIREGRAVAKACGIRLAFDPIKLIHRVREGDLSGIRHQGSMRPDVLANQPTEIDVITGALVRRASRAGIKTPALKRILAEAKAAGA
jgi:2-dehydropantoate 2-reductase